MFWWCMVKHFWFINWGFCRRNFCYHHNTIWLSSAHDVSNIFHPISTGDTSPLHECRHFHTRLFARTLAASGEQVARRTSCQPPQHRKDKKRDWGRMLLHKYKASCRIHRKLRRLLFTLWASQREKHGLVLCTRQGVRRSFFFFLLSFLNAHFPPQAGWPSCLLSRTLLANCQSLKVLLMQGVINYSPEGKNVFRAIEDKKGWQTVNRWSSAQESSVLVIFFER